MAEQRQRRTGSSGRTKKLITRGKKKKMSKSKLKNRQKAQLKQKSNQATVSLTESFNGDQIATHYNSTGSVRIALVTHTFQGRAGEGQRGDAVGTPNASDGCHACRGWSPHIQKAGQQAFLLFLIFHQAPSKHFSSLCIPCRKQLLPNPKTTTVCHSDHRLVTSLHTGAKEQKGKTVNG